MLSENTIRELKEIIANDYGREISFKEATEIANNLTLWFDSLAKIYHRIKTKDTEKNGEQ